MGTGTTSDAYWACQGDGKNVHFFFQIVEGVLPACVHPKRLGGRGFHGHRHDFTCRLGMLGRREKQSLLQIVEGELPVWLHPEIL